MSSDHPGLAPSPPVSRPTETSPTSDPRGQSDAKAVGELVRKWFAVAKR